MSAANAVDVGAPGSSTCAGVERRVEPGMDARPRTYTPWTACLSDPSRSTPAQVAPLQRGHSNLGVLSFGYFSLDKCSDRTHPLQVCQDMVYTLRLAQIDVREAVMAEVEIVVALF